MTDEQQDQFIDEYFKHEGIQLDPNNIEYNQGLRQTMKIILNSLWGKFGQRGNMPQAKVCMQAKDFYSIIFNEKFEVTGLHQCPTNTKAVEVAYRELESTTLEPLNTNVYIASFTTCWARLKLYTLLEKLGRRVLYYDTDSVIYVNSKDRGDESVPLGKCAPVTQSVSQSTVRQSTVRQSTVRQSTVRQSTVRKSTVRQSTVRQSTVRQSTVRQSTVRDNR